VQCRPSSGTATTILEADTLIVPATQATHADAPLTEPDTQNGGLSDGDDAAIPRIPPIPNDGGNPFPAGHAATITAVQIELGETRNGGGLIGSLLIDVMLYITITDNEHLRPNIHYVPLQLSTGTFDGPLHAAQQFEVADRMGIRWAASQGKSLVIPLFYEAHYILAYYNIRYRKLEVFDSARTYMVCVRTGIPRNLCRMLDCAPQHGPPSRFVHSQASLQQHLDHAQLPSAGSRHSRLRPSCHQQLHWSMPPAQDAPRNHAEKGA